MKNKNNLLKEDTKSIVIKRGAERCTDIVILHKEHLMIEEEIPTEEEIHLLIKRKKKRRKRKKRRRKKRKKKRKMKRKRRRKRKKRRRKKRRKKRKMISLMTKLKISQRINKRKKQSFKLKNQKLLMPMGLELKLLKMMLMLTRTVISRKSHQRKLKILQPRELLRQLKMRSLLWMSNQKMIKPPKLI